MRNLLSYYQNLFDIYSKLVKNLENEWEEDKENKNSNSIPYKMLNSAIFTCDEILKNKWHNKIFYKEKNSIMPPLVQFLAAYEKSSQEDKSIFENLKPKNEYQKYLDELYLDKIPFGVFLELQLNRLKDEEGNCQRPSQPSRRNATRQLAKYNEDKRQYEKEIEIIRMCRNELNDRLQLFKELFKEIP